MFDALVPFDPSKSPTLIRPVTPKTVTSVLSEIGAIASSLAAIASFTGSAGSSLVIPKASGSGAGEIEAVLFGVEEEQKAEPFAPFALGALARSLPDGAYVLAEDFPDAETAALGFALSAYSYDRYHADEAARHPQLMVRDAVSLDRLKIIINGVTLVRDLINTPSNDFGPEELASAAEELFLSHGGKTSVIVGDDLLKRNFPMIHAVGKGSARAPRLIDCHWGRDSDPKLTLVGKGVVFDTGGLNLKPGSSMALMKKDMGGAANVLGLASMIMASGLPVRLRVLIPAVENSVSGLSFRPGDVLESHKGLTVEIGNTDAEGRLVLGDALSLADEEEPELMIDMATLTGAARVALGPDVPPFYTNDDALADAVAGEASAVQDPLWRMPLWQPYMKYLDSKIADINHVNTSGAGFAGSITAALFLSRFVEKAASWAHFDIYGWTPMEKPGKPFGGEAQAIRALFSLLQKRFPVAE